MAACPRFRGENLERNLALVDALRAIAEAKGVTVAQLAIAWVLRRGDDIVPLIGARTARAAGRGARRARAGARRRRPGRDRGGGPGRGRGRRPLRRAPDGHARQRARPSPQGLNPKPGSGPENELPVWVDDDGCERCRSKRTGPGGPRR